MTLRDHLADLSRYVNISIAKKISFIIIIVLTISNILSYLDDGLDPCRGVLLHGRMLDKNEGVWQPHGCMLHNYRPKEALSCLEGRKIVFIGDSRIRELMFRFIQSINQDYQVPEGKIHSEVDFVKDQLDFRFLWYPEPDDATIALYDHWRLTSHPDIVFHASASHTIKRLNGSEEGLKQYTRNVTNLANKMVNLSAEQNTKVFWIMQEPVLESRLSAARKMITNRQLDDYNAVARDVFTHTIGRQKVRLIESFARVSEEVIGFSDDGLHVPWQSLQIEAKILLNILCNNRLHPDDGTCCRNSPGVTLVQLFTALIGFVTIISSCIISFAHWRKASSTKKNAPVMNGDAGQDMEKLLPTNSNEKMDKTPTKLDATVELATALAKHAVIMVYFFVCDRTNIFMKANKHFTHARFFLPLLYLCFLGVFGIIPTSQTALLNRDQTDEWKGWMQLVILIYHISGASVNVPIYMHIRLLVAMYLFMTGYGHFSYFWHKGDYSLYRVLNVLFRLNFLTVSLCLVMSRPYQFYYFVPLCSFWFLVLYVSMAMWPRANAKMLQGDGSETKGFMFNLTSPYFIMMAKLLVMIVLIAILFMSERYYEAIFSWWPAIRLFELPEGSVREWWFRCQLDRYAMLYGAIFCFIYIILKKLSILDDSKQGCLVSIRATFITLTFSIAVILGYIVWAGQCKNKVTCNRIHSYASILPMSSFIIIRNVPGYLRSGYSAFFAWFGKISLELFIGQYHIWLAGDTKGMLVVISPDWPTLNLVITSFVFVCVAHEINSITGIVTKHFLGPPNGDKGRVFTRFVVILMVICGISLLESLRAH